MQKQLTTLSLIVGIFGAISTGLWIGASTMIKVGKIVNAAESVNTNVEYLRSDVAILRKEIKDVADKFETITKEFGTISKRVELLERRTSNYYKSYQESQ